MNKKQKLVLWVGIVMITLMGAFPPWVSVDNIPNSNIKRTQPIGYEWLWTSPTLWRRDPLYHHARVIDTSKGMAIDTSRLYVQWAVVALITAGLIYTFKDKKDKRTKDE